jgi:hypothetical protein
MLRASRQPKPRTQAGQGTGEELTCLAGVRVPSTSNRQIVPLAGRFSREGYTLAASVAMVAVEVGVAKSEWSRNDKREIATIGE